MEFRNNVSSSLGGAFFEIALKNILGILAKCLKGFCGNFGRCRNNFSGHFAKVPLKVFTAVLVNAFKSFRGNLANASKWLVFGAF